MNLPKVAERVCAPRTLLVDRDFGIFLGPPKEEQTQRATLLAAFDLLVHAREPGTVSALGESDPGAGGRPGGPGG